MTEIQTLGLGQKLQAISDEVNYERKRKAELRQVEEQKVLAWMDSMGLDRALVSYSLSNRIYENLTRPDKTPDLYKNILESAERGCKSYWTYIYGSHVRALYDLVHDDSGVTVEVTINDNLTSWRKEFEEFERANFYVNREVGEPEESFVRRVDEKRARHNEDRHRQVAVITWP